MKIIYLTLLIGLLAACSKPAPPEEKAINDAVALVESNPSDSSFAALYAAIQNLADTKGYNDSLTARQILRAAQLSESKGKDAYAMDYYKLYTIHYTDRPDQADKLVHVMTIVEKRNEPTYNQVLYKSFVNRFPDHAKTAELSGKIENKDITVDSTLLFIGQNIFNDSTFRLNESMANLYIESVELAAMADPKLVNAPEHLHRAAETARTLRDIPHAIRMYDWIISVYPDHPRAATSLFLKAFTYDNDLKDFEKAGKYYNEFLTKYPNNDFTESAKFLLENLGKSEEELKKILDERAKTQQESVQ